MSSDWQYLAGRLVGDGTIEVTETELPLNLQSLSRNLSAPSSMSGTISAEVKRLKGNNGRPIFEPGSTVLMAEASGVLRAMALYQQPTFEDNVWTLNGIGLSGYPLGMPYDGEIEFVQADPLSMYRHIWSHLQSWPGGNLGVTVDSTTSPVRVGTATTTEDDFESGPRKLNWWSTPNLGQVIDDLSREAPFDWLERVSWGGDQPQCHIELGYPTIGSRHNTHRIVLGENLAQAPRISEDAYYNEVMVLGNGEGRVKVRGHAGVADGRLRQVKVVEDESIMTVTAANARARLELDALRGQFTVDTLTVYDHKNAPLESVELGMEVALYAETDHAVVDDYVRVVGKAETPDRTDMAVLTVVRVGIV